MTTNNSVIPSNRMSLTYLSRPPIAAIIGRIYVVLNKQASEAASN
jgi:hypothetical protein